MPRKESPFRMRRDKRTLTRRVNGDVCVEFGDERLTSYGGLELLTRHLREIGFNDRLRKAFSRIPLGGDYPFISMIRLLVAMLLVGARRLRHVRFLSRDPMILRFCGLRTAPEERTLARWLGRFNSKSLKALAVVSQDLVFDAIRRLKLRRLTLDIDGTVVSTGLQVEWAFRGFNPHHRKVPSYYPILAHLAETGQVLSVKNRPGNVHDGKRGVVFLRDLIRLVRSRVGRRVRLRMRMDGAFFQREVIETLSRSNVDFALKVPMHQWLELKPRIQMRTRWKRVATGISSFEMILPIRQWGQRLRVVCYRKQVFHQTAKNYQLDLFSPDDGTFEYSAVATNLGLSPKRLWFFMAGRGAQEKTLAELKGGLAFDSVPTKRYAANSAWQWISVLAHNLHRDFQLARGTLQRRRSPKATYLFPFESIHTSRFEWLNAAGRLLRLAEGLTLRLPKSPDLERRYRGWLQAV
jgi:hypothetical protein